MDTGRFPVFVGVRVAPEHERKLRALGETTRCTRSEVIRLLIEAAEAELRPQLKVQLQCGGGHEQ